MTFHSVLAPLSFQFCSQFTTWPHLSLGRLPASSSSLHFNLSKKQHFISLWWEHRVCFVYSSSLWKLTLICLQKSIWFQNHLQFQFQFFSLLSLLLILCNFLKLLYWHSISFHSFHSFRSSCFLCKNQIKKINFIKLIEKLYLLFFSLNFLKKKRIRKVELDFHDHKFISHYFYFKAPVNLVLSTFSALLLSYSFTLLSFHFMSLSASYNLKFQ